MSRTLSFVLASVVLLGRAHAQPSATSLTAPPNAASLSVELRPIDLATVRVVAVGGIGARIVDSDATRVRRLVAEPSGGHGTAFFVDAVGLLATARHVVAGADMVAVILPGSDDPVPARVVYSDPAHDIAFLHVPVVPTSVVPLPTRVRRLAVGEALTGSGFPVDVRQRYPAASFGVVAREANNGTLQTSMSVNPGNSGGPVVDARGELVGLVSMSSNVRAGFQGIAWLEPLRAILPGLAIARENVARGMAPFTEADAIAARILTDFYGTMDDVPIFERTSLELVQRAAATAPSSHVAVLLAAHAWNVHIALLEERRANDLPALPTAEQADATRMRAIASAMARRAYDTAPFLRISYSFGISLLAQGDRSIVVREAGR